jgi:two-component system uhpT operon response regulator UhpA
MTEAPVLFEDTVTVTIVDDHDVVRYGFESICTKSNFELLASAATVSECLNSLGDKTPQVAVLDLSLADGSNVFENVKAFVDRNIQVLVFSIGDKAAKNREALKAGAAALVTKSAGLENLAQTIYYVAHGVPINNLQTAAAIDSDVDFKDAKLSPREREVLSLYASGYTQKQVAFELGVTQSTVKEHVDRVRKKFADVGRPITDKTDFLKRAIEDGLIQDIE